ALFFFSSRRRHTISKRDWSSDVCSSDLKTLLLPTQHSQTTFPTGKTSQQTYCGNFRHVSGKGHGGKFACKQRLRRLRKAVSFQRSEERRVGKECMSRRGAPLDNERRNM